VHPPFRIFRLSVAAVHSAPSSCFNRHNPCAVALANAPGGKSPSLFGARWSIRSRRLALLVFVCSSGPLAIPPSRFISASWGLPLALMGTWALIRNEGRHPWWQLPLHVSASLHSRPLSVIVSTGRWRVSQFACAADRRCVMAVAFFRDVPAKAGLGVQDWPWFYGPRQARSLIWKKLLGDGRRCRVERLMSWADLRFGRTWAGLRTATAYAEGYGISMLLRSRADAANGRAIEHRIEPPAPLTTSGYAVGWAGRWNLEKSGNFPARNEAQTGGNTSLHALDPERAGQAHCVAGCVPGATLPRKPTLQHGTLQCRRHVA